MKRPKIEAGEPENIATKLWKYAEHIKAIEQYCNELEKENEELKEKIAKALEHSDDDITSSLRVILMVEALKQK